MIRSVFFGYHDSCITFANDGRIVLHLEAERHFKRAHARLGADEMDELVAVGLEHLGADITDIETLLLAEWFSDYDLDRPVILGRQFKPTITSHHMNHIGSTFPAGFDDFVAVVADGGSEDGSTKIYHFSGGKTSLLSDHDDDIISGKFFGTLTQMIVSPDHRLAHQFYPGKLMGLAPYGMWSDEMAALIDTNADDMNKLKDDCSDLLDAFGLNPSYDAYWRDERRRNLAYTGQEIWLRRFSEVIRRYMHLSDNLTLSGGCALNIHLNERVRRSGWFENVYVPPVASDSGQSLGAILFNFPETTCTYPFLGRCFGDIEHAPVSTVVDDLLDEKIVAWYQGAAEIGPRALGHRSLLGVPTSPNMRKKLSVDVKGREAFRPVSPVVPEIFASDWFEPEGASPYMTFAPTVRDDLAAKIPAVVHCDGTARIQTVTPQQHKPLFDVLIELADRGHAPVLMNSSFNLGGEAMADTPDDARRVFRDSGADVLYINGVRVARDEL